MHLHNLLEQRPKFHGREKAGSEHYAISDDVLKWIFKNLREGGNTLETGCGYSTIIFALKEGFHTTISPFKNEHSLIKKWCKSEGIKTEGVCFICSTSQTELPFLDIKLNLWWDMVLIDGDHAFPTPFIDWYYTADRIKKGGILIVDDTQLITGRILKDFLKAETDRWVCIEEIDKTSIFEKRVSSAVARGISWINQPFLTPGTGNEPA